MLLKNIIITYNINLVLGEDKCTLLSSFSFNFRNRVHVYYKIKKMWFCNIHSDNITVLMMVSIKAYIKRSTSPNDKHAGAMYSVICRVDGTFLSWAFVVAVSADCILSQWKSTKMLNKEICLFIFIYFFFALKSVCFKSRGFLGFFLENSIITL